MNVTKTFLIVDDDIDDCEFFWDALREVDSTAKCLIAKDGKEALLKLRSGIKKLPNFIFLDLNMPLMDGKACLIELKKDEKLKNIPVIIYTTSSDQKDIRETRELGAAYFITKPSDFQKLKSKIILVLQTDWSHRPMQVA